MAAGNKPGFMDTFRQGWAPAGRRAGGARAAGGTTQRQPRAGARRGRGRSAAAPTRPGPGASKASPALIKRRDELSRNFAELQWDLGGIAYEMARRDHYRLEVLNAQAAKLQEIDAELGQIERMVKLDEAGAAGSCPACGALQARGASFCWRCGKEVPIAEPKPAKAKPAKGAKPKAETAEATTSEATTAEAKTAEAKTAEATATEASQPTEASKPKSP